MTKFNWNLLIKLLMLLVIATFGISVITGKPVNALDPNTVVEDLQVAVENWKYEATQATQDVTNMMNPD